MKIKVLVVLIFGLMIGSLLFVNCSGDGGGNSKSKNQSPGSITATANESTPQFVSFSLSPNGNKGIINGQDISVIEPFGTNVTALVATFTTSSGASVVVGSTPQVSGQTPNDFTKPVTYVLTNAGVVATYTVNVTIAPSTSAELTSFCIGVQCASVQTGNSYSVVMPFNTNLTSLVPTFTTTGASVKVGSTEQLTGQTPNNFTNPVTYIVTAADGQTTSNYTITVTKAADNNVAFSNYAIGPYLGVYSGANITVTVPFGTALTNLISTFNAPLSAQNVLIGSVPQVSGTTANNFTSPLTYVVTAADGVTKGSYTVTVKNAPNSAAEMTSFSVNGFPGVLQTFAPATYASYVGTFTVSVPVGFSISNLTATFNTSVNAKSVLIGSTPQVSGQTVNNFSYPTYPVTYTVTAADGVTTGAYSILFNWYVPASGTYTPATGTYNPASGN